jgi:hypothetical protein
VSSKALGEQVAEKNYEIAIIRCRPERSEPCPRAPFSGVLFSDKAFAEQQAKKEFLEERAKNELQLQLGLQRSKLLLATATTAASLDAEKAKLIELRKIWDKREQQLIQNVDDAVRPLWIDCVIFVAGGVAVVLGAWSVSMIAGG